MAPVRCAGEKPPSAVIIGKPQASPRSRCVIAGFCDAHLVIEAQHWDTRGWDGVDIHCQEHRNLSLDSRDVFRGNGLPPAPRWEGDEAGLLLAY